MVLCVMVDGGGFLGVPPKVWQPANGSPHRCQQACVSASAVWPCLQLRCVIAAYLMNTIRDASGIDAVPRPLSLVRIIARSLSKPQIQVACAAARENRRYH